MTEIYVSTDIEADGPIPVVNSLLSLASAAFYSTGELVATIKINLELLPEARPDTQTMAWWEKYPEAWERSRENVVTPELGMIAYVEWVEALPDTPVFVGYPAPYDFMWVYWYMMRFVGRSPFRHHALDIRSYAMAALKQNFKQAGKQNMPAHWLSEKPHTHDALDDAIVQGVLFCNMLRENLATDHQG